MRPLLIKTACLFTPLLLFCYFLEVRLDKVVNNYSFKKACLEDRLDSIQVLVLGSSQATEGINPAFFSEYGFNLANMSQSLFYDTRLALKYIDRMPKLKYAIITLSYFSFGYQISDGIEGWKDYYYSQFWGIDFPELGVLDLRRYSKLALYTPLQSLIYFRKGFKVPLDSEFKSNGYLKIDMIGNDLNINDSLGRKRVKFHDKYFREDRVAGNVKDLETLIRAFKKKNVTPVLLTTPVFPTYSKFADEHRLLMNDSIINKLCSENGCRYYNYFLDKRFIKTDFVDNDHLNFMGAEKFSRIIDEEVIKGGNN